ncbi:hypothetical protein Pla144_10280 [Bythopirellula polymerisocia]|uniref:Uncharacterized protein n=1 Tax=Bythopirellula polymerisocia TaxID=2528003 RepID=A0A5C6D017_9BACT|nr:hypothetical protein Pla144_10280 [Bythopirellula polymerisocia]
MPQESNNSEQPKDRTWLARPCKFIPISTYADFCVVFAIITFILIIFFPTMLDGRHGYVPDKVGVPLDSGFAKDVGLFPPWLRLMIQVRCSGWLVSFLASALAGILTGFVMFLVTKLLVHR